MKQEYNLKPSPLNLPPAAYLELKGRIARYEAWRAGRTCVKVSEIPAGLEVSNEDRGRVELYEFLTQPPTKYFLYIREGNPGSPYAQATTFTGEWLGTAFVGPKYRDNFGGTRRAVTIPAANGYTYVGTYYCSAGQYARVRMSAASKKRFERTETPAVK